MSTYEDDNRISITVCGDGGCGKSSITLRLVRSQWTDGYDPTIEDSYSVTRQVDGRTYYLSVTDTAGQEEYRGLWATSNLKSDAFLLVYDITNASTLSALSQFVELISYETDERIDRGNIPPVKMVVGNKCDLKESREVKAGQGLEWARDRGCGFMETSARDMVNIEETFALIVRRVVEARKLHTQGIPHAAAVTAPLTPLTEKEAAAAAAAAANGRKKRRGGDDASYGFPIRSGFDDEDDRGGRRRGGGGGFFRRLKCW